MNVEFQYPTVVLEHIDSISNVTCPSSNKLVVVFTNPDLFQKAVGSWPKSDFCLVNNADGCGNTPNQRNVFWAASYTADSGSLTIETTGQMMGLNEPKVVKNFVAQFGHYASAQAVPSPATTQTPQKRDPSAKDWISSKDSAMKSDITSKETAAKSSITSKETAAKSSITSEASAVKSSVSSDASAAEKGFSKGATETISFSDGPKPTELSQSPFGQAEKLTTVDGLTIWCVDCGASGTIDLSGEIATNSDKITAGSLNFQALDFKIPFTFGFEAKGMTISHDFSHPLPEIPLTPFEVEPFFSIGPKLTFAIDLNVAVSATGNLKAGVNMHWANASASMDIVKSDSKTLQKGGWIPDVEKVFDFSGGEMAINASLGIPMSFEVGLSLWSHPVSKNISITDRPTVQLDSNFNIPGKSRRDHVRDLKVRDKQCPNGIDETIGFTNNVNVNVLGLWSTQLESFSTSLWSTCIKTAGHSTSTSSSSSSSSPSTALVKTTTSGLRNSTTPTSTPSVIQILPTGGSGSTGSSPKNYNSTASNAFTNSPSYGTAVPTLTDTSGSTGSFPQNYNSTATAPNSLAGTPLYGTSLPTLTGGSGSTDSFSNNYNSTATASYTSTQSSSYDTSLPTSSSSLLPLSIPTPSTNPSGPTALSSTQKAGASGSAAPSGFAGPSGYVRKRGGLDGVVREIRVRRGY